MKQLAKIVTITFICAFFSTNIFASEKNKKSNSAVLRGKSNVENIKASDRNDERIVLGKVKSVDAWTKVIKIITPEGKEREFLLTDYTKIVAMEKTPKRGPRERQRMDNDREPVVSDGNISDIQTGFWVTIPTRARNRKQVEKITVRQNNR